MSKTKKIPLLPSEVSILENHLRILKEQDSSIAIESAVNDDYFYVVIVGFNFYLIKYEETKWFRTTVHFAMDSYIPSSNSFTGPVALGEAFEEAIIKYLEIVAMCFFSASETNKLDWNSITSS